MWGSTSNLSVDEQQAVVATTAMAAITTKS
jgi:hypothetical protein